MAIQRSEEYQRRQMRLNVLEEIQDRLLNSADRCYVVDNLYGGQNGRMNLGPHVFHMERFRFLRFWRWHRLTPVARIALCDSDASAVTFHATDEVVALDLHKLGFVVVLGTEMGR